jgi:hypothetical protein
MAKKGEVKDISGMSFGKLTVIKLGKVISKSDYRVYYWVCLCSCGNQVEIRAGNLGGKTGTQSCGCLKKERHLESHQTHGMSLTPTYESWRSMLKRCYNKNHDNYFRYGAKGITVCEAWKSFSKFFEDMGVRPLHHTLDRIDSTGNYSKENCRWADAKQQAANRKNPDRSKNGRVISYNGQEQNMTAWAKDIGINKTTLANRLKRLPLEQALEMKKYERNNE